MIDSIYVEEEVKSHPRTAAICRRFPGARVIPCGRWGGVFNRKAQSFRLQKRRPALVLAKKYGRFVLDAPPGYGIGPRRNFYFSHMLNCIYDCRYCFLQGMFRSANLVLFVNYEDFESEIAQMICESPDEAPCFFSGYDCDSLAFDRVSGFVHHFIPFFERHPNAWLELRTKSVQIESLIERPSVPNCIVAFSLTPAETGARLELKTPPLASRLEARKKLAQRGWRLGLRFDPLIDHERFQEQYEKLFRQVFQAVPVASLHSVSLGPFRLPKPVYENMWRLYPDEQLLAGPLEERNGMVSYERGRETWLLDIVTRAILRYVPKKILFPCFTPGSSMM